MQGEIIGASKTIFGHEDFELMGSGRTDAGVHALAQVAHLDVKSVLAPHIIRLKLNDELPADINILDVAKADPRFHARHDAVARSYLYQISTRRSAFGKRFVWWVKDSLDLPGMQTAGQLFEGMHDFRSFTRDDPEEKSTKVLLDEVRIEKVGALILIRITGSHFLWNMVKQMVGVLVEVGRKNFTGKDVERFLSTDTDDARKYTASPSGLYLEQVYYKGDERAKGLSPLLEIH